VQPVPEKPEGEPGPSETAEARRILETVRDRLDGAELGDSLTAAATTFRRVDGRLRPHFGSDTRPSASLGAPERATGAVHLVDLASNVSVDVTLDGALDVAAEAAGDSLVFPHANPSGATWLHRALSSGFEDLLSFEFRPRAASVSYRLALGEGVKGLRLVANTLELLDDGGAPRLRVAPPYVVGADGARTNATIAVAGCSVDRNPSGPWGRPVTAPGHKDCTLRVSWNDRTVSYPAVLDPRWTATGNMIKPRQGHTATLLGNGKVLAAGGTSSTTLLGGTTVTLPNAELYDRTTNTWAATANMPASRQLHGAVLLGATGNSNTANKALITGGWDGTASQSTAYLYDATAGTWSTAAAMPAIRHGHTTTLLASGQVLVAGGQNAATGSLMTAATYNPGGTGTGTWAATGAMTSSARSHTATLITGSSNTNFNNKVLIVGGINNGSGSTISVVQLFDGVSSFSTVASLPAARDSHTATLVAGGKVLVTGGKSGTATFYSSTVIFDPGATGTTGSWASAGTMTAQRQLHTATLLSTSILSNGQVLVAGGNSAGGAPLNTAELWNGTTTWTATSTLTGAVQAQTATLLGSGAVLLAGGRNTSTTLATAAQAYDPSWALSCTSNGQCALGFCVNGVCCDTACNTGCGACNLTGKVGTCSPVAVNTACPDDGNVCTTDKCDGTTLTCQHAAGNPGATCRAAAGECDLAETCTGTSTTCPPDAKKAANTACTDDGNVCTTDTCDGTNVTCQHAAGNAGTTCRAAAGECDVAETCTGTSTACPADAKKPPNTACTDDGNVCTTDKCDGTNVTCQHAPGNAGTVCRAATSGGCDVAETCTGTSSTCPTDGFAAAGTSCRAAAGECDLAEVCPGNSPNCPADSKKPVNTACTDDGNACTTDLCDGSNVLCQHAPGNPGATCRAAAGECDLPETCTGTSASCPTDAKKPPNTACTDDGNVCTTDKCDGTNVTCQHAPGNPGVTCRAAAGECDLAETCTGTSATCPTDAKKPPNTACTDDGNVCTTDQCDGTNVACQHAPGNPGKVCRPATSGGCDVAETCTGTSASCPADGFAAPGTSCRVAAGECDLAEVCPGNSPNCPGDSKKPVNTPCTDDGLVCTTDLCDGSNVLCQHAAGNAGTVCRTAAGECDAPEACTGSSTACPTDLKKPVNTACTDDGLACTTDLCDGTNVACQHTAGNAGTVCRTAVGECDAVETCTGSSTACPADAKKPSGTACTDDGLVCTTDLCDGTNVACQHAPGNAGTVCRAAAGACDVAEACDGASASCPADVLVAAGTICRASAGQCDLAEACTGTAVGCPADGQQPNGTACDDGNPASTNDVCEAGVCAGLISGRYLPLTIVDALNPGDTLTRAADIAQDGSMTGWSGTAFYPGGAPAVGFVRPEVGPAVTLPPPAPNVPLFPQHINAQGYVPSYAYPPNAPGEGLLHTTPGQPPQILPVTGAVSVTDVDANGSYLIGTQEVATGGALAAWTFDNDAHDVVPKADGHTSLNNLAAASSRFAGGVIGTHALTFNGTDSDCLTTTASADNDPGTSGFTIMTWVKARLLDGPNGCQASPVPLFRRGHQFALGLQCGNGHSDVVRALVNLTGAVPASYNGTGPSIPENTWVHIAVTYDNHKVRYYVNGQAAGVETAEGGINGPAQNVFMGGCYEPNVDLFGSLDQMAVFRQALTQDQIQLHKDGAVPYPMLFSGDEWGRIAYDGVSQESQLSVVPPLTGPGYAGSGYPWAMNSRGDIVGKQVASGGGGYIAAFSSFDKGTIDLNSLLDPDSDWTLTFASGLNDSRFVVGSGLHNGQANAFRLNVETGEIVDVGRLPPPYDTLPMVARAVNSANHVIGAVWDPTLYYPQRAYIYTDGTGIVDLNDFIDPASGWVLRDATAINDSDEIVGFATHADYSMIRAYRLKVPSMQSIACAGKVEGAACSDDTCIVGKTCHAGACTAGAPAPDGTSCDDKNACTVADTCQGGVCQPGLFPQCSLRPLGQCQVENPGCDAVSGCLPPTNAPDGTSCNDGDACTQTDVCLAGRCVGSNSVVCPGADDCHDASTCSPQTGLCSTPPVTGTSPLCAGGTFDYDKAGRLVRDHGTSLVFDAYDQLRAVVPVPASGLPLSNLPVEDLGNIGDGTRSFGENTNDAGQVLINATVAGANHAFLTSGPSTSLDISATGGIQGSSYATGLSSAGDVLMNQALGPADAYQPWRLRAPNTIEQMPPLPNGLGWGVAINSSGDFVGYLGTFFGARTAFRYTDAGGYEDLGSFGGPETDPWSIDDDGTVYLSSDYPDSPRVLSDTSHFGHAAVFDPVTHQLRDLNALIDTTISPGWTLYVAVGGDAHYYYGEGDLNGAHQPFRLNKTTGEVLPTGLVGAGKSFIDHGNRFDDLAGWGYKDAGNSQLAGWVHLEGRGFFDLNDLIDPASSWHIDTAYKINDEGDVVGQGELNGQTRAYRIRLPLRTAGAAGPTLAEAHTYGYDGLRTSTSTGSDLMTLTQSQYWFTQDYTETTAGNREHYVRVGNRIVAKVAMTPVGNGAFALPTSVSRGKTDRDGHRGPRTGLGALLLALGLLGGLFSMLSRRRGWVPATAAAMALVLTATSCEMFGVTDKVKAAVWQAGTGDNAPKYFHGGIAPGPTIITSSTGDVFEERRYEPFGQPIDAKRGMAPAGAVNFTVEPQNILGKLTDPNTGWSYHGARWMAPQTARWLSPDPSAKAPYSSYLSNPWSLHPYQYVSQSPTIFWDPNGLQEEKGVGERVTSRGVENETFAMWRAPEYRDLTMEMWKERVEYMRSIRTTPQNYRYNQGPGAGVSAQALRPTRTGDVTFMGSFNVRPTRSDPGTRGDKQQGHEILPYHFLRDYMQSRGLNESQTRRTSPAWEFQYNPAISVNQAEHTTVSNEVTRLENNFVKAGGHLDTWSELFLGKQALENTLVKTGEITEDQVNTLFHQAVRHAEDIGLIPPTPPPPRTGGGQ
jgi:RHS repeat-associated protein